MDHELEARLLQFLAGREGKAKSTMKWMMQRFERMEELGFRYADFAQGLEAAENEAERFIAGLRLDDWKPGGVRNYQKNILALARFHKFRHFEIRLEPEARPKPRIYSRQELDKLHSLPYGRNEVARARRALTLTHLAFGMRAGELARMWRSDLNPAANTFFVRFPEKRNPQRTLPVWPEVYRDNRPLMAWLDHRPEPVVGEKDALWTFTDRHDVVRPMPPWKVAEELALGARDLGVAANCIRGRHTCATALVYQGNKLPYVAYYLGHGNLATLYKYVEMVDADLAKHLQGSKWLRKTDKRLDS